MGWDGISPDRSISRSPDGDNKAYNAEKSGRNSQRDGWESSHSQPIVFPLQGGNKYTRVTKVTGVINVARAEGPFSRALIALSLKL